MKKFFKIALLTIFAIIPFMMVAGLKECGKLMNNPIIDDDSEEWEEDPMYEL